MVTKYMQIITQEVQQQLMHNYGTCVCMVDEARYIKLMPVKSTSTHADSRSVHACGVGR